MPHIRNDTVLNNPKAANQASITLHLSPVSALNPLNSTLVFSDMQVTARYRKTYQIAGNYN